MTNLGRLQGANPIFRVGGSSQDHALYNSSLPLSTPTLRNHSSVDPKGIAIGPGFFDAFKGLPGINFTFVLNFAGNTSNAATSLNTTAKLVCQTLGSSLSFWELGNEPDLYTGATPPLRPSNWKEQDYVNEWLEKSEIVTEIVASNCPHLVVNGKMPFVAPSFWNVSDELRPVTSWDDNLGKDGNIDLITGHVYIAKAFSSATLQGTLMNHTRTALEINDRMDVWNQVTAKSKTYFAFNEIGSLFNTGQPGVSDVFGSALWTMDFSLYAASRGVGRLHWQQGTNFSYNAWDPIDLPGTFSKGTKAPYYGLIASSAFIGNSAQHKIRVLELDVADPVQSSAYACYRDGTLERLALLQMTAYRSDSSGSRKSLTFTYQLPSDFATKNITTRFLSAVGSDVTSGIAFGGKSYETNNGVPVPVTSPVGVGQVNRTADGLLTVILPYSSAVVLQFS
jgi:glycosyl hydrolase family 79